ncbi:hypothetical protein [Intestinimonas sp. HCP28S3_D6]|uniref:hypothetical protein n=1 Tax=Intestinimonas sp. HCP28S3_D6 TaxID=3438942 RepID=UPI003F88F415
MRKENGFLFHIHSVAVLVSGKSPILQGYSFSGNESNKKLKKSQNSKDNCRKGEI